MCYRTQLANRTSELLLTEHAPINDMAFDSQSSALWVATASSSVRRFALHLSHVRRCLPGIHITAICILAGQLINQVTCSVISTVHGSHETVTGTQRTLSTECGCVTGNASVAATQVTQHCDSCMVPSKDKGS